MKRKFAVIGSVVVVLLFVPIEAHADLIGDAALLFKIWTTSKNMYDNAKQAASYFRSPGLMKAQLYGAMISPTGALNRTSNGRDIVILQALTDSLGSTQRTISEINGNGSLTTENAVLASLLHLQAVQAKIERDQLQTDLQYQSDKQTYASVEGYGLGTCVSCTIRPLIK